MQKKGCLKVNIVEACIDDAVSTDCACFMLIETRESRQRTQATAGGDECSERTWATEVAELNICKKSDLEMRLWLISQKADDTCEVIGNALVQLDCHVSQQRTERWYLLSMGCKNEGGNKIGCVRVRTLWCPSDNALDEAITADQEPQQVPITFLDGTQAAHNGAIADMQPFFKQQGLKHD